MKKMLSMLLLTFGVLTVALAQKTDSARLKLDYGSAITEVQELFRLEHIDYYKLSSNDPLLKQYYFFFTMKTYDAKGLVKTDTLIQGKEGRSITLGEKDTVLTYTLLSKAKNADTIQFSFNLGSMGMVRPYKKLVSNNYSLRDALNSHGKYVKVPLNKSFPLFVYSLPYEDPKYPGYLFYCALTADAVPPEAWGKKYGVQHYIVIELALKYKVVSTE